MTAGEEQAQGPEKLNMMISVDEDQFRLPVEALLSAWITP
jgi:hypothetical protein